MRWTPWWRRCRRVWHHRSLKQATRRPVSGRLNVVRTAIPLRWPLSQIVGLVGHSMGSYGATRIGMKHADVFRRLYIMGA